MGKLKRRMLTNAVFGGASYAVSMLVSVFITPFLLRRLGDEVYGVIPLVNAVTMFLGLLSVGVYSALGRYVTYHLARGETKEANEYLNTGLGLLSGMALIGLVPLAAIVVLMPHLFQLPASHVAEVQLVTLLTGLNCLISIAASPLGVPLYSTQRLALRYSLDIADVLIRTALIIAAFLCIRAHVVYVALATVISTIIVQCGHYGFSRVLVPSLRISRGNFNRARLRQIFSFSFYTMLAQVGLIILEKTDLLLVNWLYGMNSVTIYSLASRWRPMISSMLWTMMAVVVPVVTELDAAGNREKITEAMVRGMRYCLILATLPSVLLPMFGSQLLETWVGAEYTADGAPILIVITVPILFTSASAPIAMVLQGMGRVRFPAFVTVAGAVVNIAASLVLAKICRMGMLGIAAGTAVASLTAALVAYPVYARQRLGISLVEHFKGYMRPVAGLLPMMALAIWLASHVNLIGWPRLLAGYALCSLVYAATVFVAILNGDDRRIIRHVFTLRGTR